MAKLRMETRNEVLGKYKAKYRKAGRKEKGEIPDTVCETTGLSRDRVRKVLSSHAKAKVPAKSPGRRGRKREYDFEICRALKDIWVYVDFACGKRLHEGVNDILDALLRFGEVKYDEEAVMKLRRISAATMDRLLKKDKDALRLKSISTTKPGTLLKRDIPIRSGQERDDAIPGFVEVDLVAHCGITTAGEYVNTLNVTDIHTGWTEPVAVLNKAQRSVFAGLMTAGQRQPFPFKGIDSDNGAEFINHELYRYCSENDIVFTRSRPYRKNDGCHVEQKNWSLVRRHIGYGRYEGETALRLLNEYYELLRLQVNFFLPSTKLMEKQRNGARVRKRCETPLTPYRRVMNESGISDSVKKVLSKTFTNINPAELMRGMMRIKDELEQLRIPD